MGAHIVTGYAGKEHVTAADAGALNAGIVGVAKYVLETANQFAAEIVSNNLVKIKSGDLINQGRHMRIDANDYEEVTIQNGAQSVKRNDLIVMRYKKDSNTLIETAELVVIKGTAGSTAKDPTYVSGDIFAGATQDDFPLYRVSLNGLNIESVTPLFKTVPNLNELNTNITKVLTLQETLTVGADSMREYRFDLSALKNKNVLTSIPVIYDNGKGITIGRVQADNATIRLWNSTGSSKNVGVMNIVFYQ